MSLLKARNEIKLKILGTLNNYGKSVISDIILKVIRNQRINILNRRTFGVAATAGDDLVLGTLEWRVLIQEGFFYEGLVALITFIAVL